MRTLLAVYCAALAILVSGAVGGGILLLDATGPDDPIDEAAERYAFNLATWELRHFPEKWLYKIGGIFRNDSDVSDDDILHRYFELTSQIRTLESDDPASTGLTQLEEERSAIENIVENILEGRMTSVLEEQGLALGPPPFTDLGLIFPPVDFEFDAPPRVLAISPRDRIDLDRSYLLTPGLDRDQVLSLEQDAESGGEASALVIQTGGVSTYPSVVSDLARYENLIDTAFHEWVHQYLIFFPLGAGYFESRETRTLNESVANISGRELAGLYFAKYGPLEAAPSPEPTPEPTESTEPPTEPFDFTAEMRALRTEVEALLAAGEIDEAEALMAEKRDEFESAGYFIRRLNQAYFAHYGFYADTGASIDPIGPKLESLLTLTGSPGEFLRRAAGLHTRAGLDRLLQDA